MIIQLEPIGIIHSCYPEKFGIPRQPGLVPSATARLELLEPCNREEMVRGLEGFSHIWIIFSFHQAREEGWRPTVRPPWLGGKKRLGVFATRSPHRPNHLGMSAVRLLGTIKEGKRLFLELQGADILDQTPVVDIKPYISYSDVIADARSGFVFAAPEQVEVQFSEDAGGFCVGYEQETGRKLRQLISETLAQDPRPAFKRDKEQEYGMSLWDVNIRWQAGAGCFFVSAVDFLVD